MYAVAPARYAHPTFADLVTLRAELEEAEAVARRCRAVGASVRLWEWGPEGARPLRARSEHKPESTEGGSDA